MIWPYFVRVGNHPMPMHDFSSTWGCACAGGKKHINSCVTIPFFVLCDFHFCLICLTFTHLVQLDVFVDRFAFLAQNLPLNTPTWRKYQVGTRRSTKKNHVDDACKHTPNQATIFGPLALKNQSAQLRHNRRPTLCHGLAFDFSLLKREQSPNHRLAAKLQ